MKRRVLSQRMQRSVFATLLACALITPALTAPALAGANSKREVARGKARIDIKNFGQVNDHIYRGGQPKDEDYQQLAALGVKTIVDLRGDNKPEAQASAKQAGLRYINLPLAPKHYPQTDAAQRFLEIVNDQANWPVYVHCAGGRHRTGALIAVYRMSVDRWDIERAYQEMKDYDFYTSGGHGCYKDYVYDYYRTRQAQHQRLAATNARTAVEAEQRF